MPSSARYAALRGARHAAHDPRPEIRPAAERGFEQRERARHGVAPMERAAQRVRRALHEARPRGPALVAREAAVGTIAAEHLVAAVSGQHDRDVLACGGRDEVRRHRRLVGKRLVEPGLELWQELLRVRLRQDPLVMIGTEELRDLARDTASPTRRRSRSRSRTSTRRGRIAAAAATTTLESMPPERKKPSGTSAII